MFKINGHNQELAIVKLENFSYHFKPHEVVNIKNFEIFLKCYYIKVLLEFSKYVSQNIEKISKTMFEYKKKKAILEGGVTSSQGQKSDEFVSFINKKSSSSRQF